MLTLDSIVTELPPLIRFSGERAAEAYYDEREAVANRRRANRRRRAPDDAALPGPGGWRPALARTLPVAPPGRGMSDLGVAAAARLEARCGAAALAPVGHVVLAHATLNERMAESAAVRLQDALGLASAVPFALGQCGTLGLYAALPVLDGLLQPEGRAVVVGADKILYPFFRVHGDLVHYGDAAAALLVRCHPAGDPGADLLAAAPARGAGRVEVLGHALACGAARDRPRHAAARAALAAELAALVERAAATALARAGLCTAALDAFAPSGFQRPFRDALGARLGISQGRCLPRPADAHLASADVFVALEGALGELAPGECRTVLFCDAALCGMAGALVARLHRPASAAAPTPCAGTTP